MELKELDCPFCDAVADWNINGVEFSGAEVYMQAICPNCKKEVVISVPMLFNQMRMFVTPKNRKTVRAIMLPPTPEKEKEIENKSEITD